MKKYSKSFERDYDFYLRNVDVLSFSGKHPPAIISDLGGRSAKECFHAFDSTGELAACREAPLLQKLLVCKASVNLHIKMWAQGMRLGVLCPPELREWLDGYGAPAWVLKAVLRQSVRSNRGQ
jgi:hypothetical protein